MKVFTTIAAMLALCASLAVLPAQAQSGDIDASKGQVTALMNEALHSFNHTMTRPQKTAALRSLIEKYGDVPASAQDMLGRYWTKATPEQQSTFTGLLLDYAIGSWVDQIGDMPAEERIDVLAAQTLENGRVLLRTQVVSPTGSTQADWMLLREANGQMAIVDVAVDGVSIIKAMGADFTSIIRAQGGRIEALFDALRKKIESYQSSHP